MRRDSTTWLITGVGGAGGGPPQGPVGRFKPKHPRARVAAAVRMRGGGPPQGPVGRFKPKHPRARVAAAARKRGNGGNAGSGSTE